MLLPGMLKRGSTGHPEGGADAESWKFDIPLPGIEDSDISVGDAVADQTDQYADVLDNMERQS